MTRKRRVLIVDDDPMARRLIASILLDSYDVTVCENVGLAENCLKGHDLILADQNLGNRSGLDLIKKTLEVGIKIPIILMSCTSIALLKKKTLADQVTGFLQKPFEEEALLAEVGRVLSLKRRLGLKVFISDAEIGL